MAITFFNKQNLPQVRQDLEEMFNEFEKKHGIRLSIGAIRFDEGSFRATMDARLMKGEGASAAPVLDRMLTMMMENHGLKINGMGGRVLTGYNSRRPKYPFSYTQGGKNWKCTLSQAKMYFSI